MLHSLIFWVAVSVFAAVQGLLMVDAVRGGGGRVGGGHRLLRMEPVWVGAPAVILIVLGLYAFRAL